ncbi:lipopolysaccharide biosynthesis protein [Paenisporosarcina sp. OV554]|uniref:lipopolysaccharide biosynthesis protein n=1 Tax=Paenisporosarcina sp. OV554 TaxID=2135694 RepID=UPI000D34F49D|nr:oligosaccharide flippase family protein [Paenisporosarcina sp. OV554]PUB15872.1 O-antigen/teichoic acid export membrane protein [Paenisporosarcina sp. OV554]
MTQLWQWKDKLLKNPFIRSLSVLMAGTALTNLIIVLTTPLLTRLYTPEEFGVYSVFLSLLFTGTILVSLRYETAIPLPEDEDEAFHLLVLSIILAFIVSALLCILFFFIPISKLLNVPELETYMWMLSLSLLGIGIFQAFNSWALRDEQYMMISRAKMTMNSSQITSQLSLGLFQLGLPGLLIGEIIGRMTGSLDYFRLIKRTHKAVSKISAKSLVKVLIGYKSYPIVSSWAALINSLGTQMPIFYLAAHFDAKTAGWFFLAQKILTIPEGLIGFSASQVYLSQAAQTARNSQEHFRQFFWDTVKKMIVIGLIIIGLVALCAPLAIKIVFGEQWIQAAEFIQILSVLYFMKIIINPISANFYVFNALGKQFISELIRFILICVSLFLALEFFVTPTTSLLCISLVSASGYIIHGIFAWSTIKEYKSEEIKHD